MNNYAYNYTNYEYKLIKYTENWKNMRKICKNR